MFRLIYFNTGDFCFVFRRDIANILGYDNFAQMSMETKMAGSVENVLNMLDM